MQLTRLAKVVTFKQGIHYIFGTILFIISAIERGAFNWAKWFKVRLHKEMVAVQGKVGKIGNSLVGPTLILVTKYYITLEYMKEDEEELITHLQCPKKTTKRIF
jgi:hypothetical protein